MKKIKLLVIDDNRNFCINVREYSRMKQDIEFCGATFDGISGLTAIKERNPDVVILDCILPELDGIGVMQHLRNSKIISKPKVIVITSCLSEFLISTMNKLGADYITSKNIDIAELVERCIMMIKYNTKKSQFKNTDELITDAICSMGISAKLKGYFYLRASIKMAIDSPDMLHPITKRLYPAIAEMFNTNETRVERDIRNAIDISCKRNPDRPKLTNAEFICSVADRIRIKAK